MNDNNYKKEIPIFSLNYVNKLFRNLNKPVYIEYYKEDKFSFDENYPKGGSGIYLKDDFDLDPEAGDFENSKNIYENLKINETQASDNRLWTYLTHVRFWSYMKIRWPTDVKNPKSRIEERYFLHNLNIRSLTHNGISRLWWYTHLTIDRSRKDIYELTKVLLSRQDIAVQILDRSLGSNKNARKALLEFLSKNPEIKDSEDKTRELLKQLNLAGGVKNIPLLKVNEIKSILEILKSGL
jgi:hypothetical protein